MLHHIDLNLLRVLTTFAHEKTVLGTATALKLTPSAVSQALKRLEKETGLQLFIRSHKSLMLTPEGKRILESTVPFFREMGQTMDELTSRKSTPKGTIRVGAPTEFAINFLIPTFSRFASSYPTISLKLKLGSPRTLIDALLKNELDLAYCDGGPYFSAHKTILATTPAFKEELVMACSRRFAEQHLTSGTAFDRLTRLRHVDYVDDHSAANIWYKHHFKRAPSHLELALVSENVNALIQGIKSDLGIGMVPSYLIQREVRNGTLVIIRTGQQELQNPLLLVQHQNKITPLREKLLLSFVRQNGAKFAGKLG